MPACTYASGPPATLTANANGAIPTIDGQSVGLSTRLLVKNQATLFQNGIYRVTALGDATHPWVLTREPDADEAAEVDAGSVVFVEFGAASSRTFWKQSLDITNIDTTGQDWSLLQSLAQVVRTVYVAGATWVYPTRASFYGVNVRCVGGGGGGGGAAATAAGQGSIGGGGGGGGYAEKWLSPLVLAGANQAVTVGAAGAANVGAAGGNGGASSFGALVAANGGAPGGTAVAAAPPVAIGGGLGGIGTVGTLLVNGDDGEDSWQLVGSLGSSGFGGGTALGGISAGIGASTAGRPGRVYGGGGSGANNAAAQVARAGGAGAGGAVIVDEYYVG